MDNAVAYCRFSSSNQREESIDAQVRAIERYCSMNNINLIHIYKDEGISGRSMKSRESFLDMVNDSKEGFFEIVLVYKFERFARNRYDHIIYEKKLNENGVKLISVLEQMTDAPESIILKAMLTGMAEYFSANLSREVKKGMTENALKSKHNGGIPPLGYDLDKERKYIVNEKEAEAVRWIFKLAAERTGLSTIAKFLNEKGYKNKVGKEFKKTSIRDTLLNRKYIGTYYHALKDKHGKLQENPIIIENSHPPIIEKDLFCKVQENFAKNKRTNPRIVKNNHYILTGYCQCGLCGGTYSGGYRSRNRDGTVYYGYECRKRKAKENDCKNKAVRKELFEESVVNIIKEKILTDENISKITEDILNIVSKKEKKKEEEVQSCEKEINKLKNMSMQLLEKNLEGFLLDDIFKKKNNELNQKITMFEHRLNALKNLNNINKKKITTYLYDLKQKKTPMDRILIEAFVHKLLVFEDYIEISLRKFPKSLEVAMGVGGSDGS